MKGKVYLVGAGPGDPELLTVKALRILRAADVVFHDELVASGILNLVPPTVLVRNVGKRCGRKAISQDEINSLMVASAIAGMTVVRLKGGDPLIFGRAGEEIEALLAAGVDFEIVPGVTAALGAAASAQIPLTHRRFASALVLLTGHRSAETLQTNWRAIVSAGATLVLYMPGDDYPGSANKLRTAGLSGQTPCVIVSCATTPQEEIYLTNLEKLPDAPRLAAPALLVVGEVARLANLSEKGEGRLQCLFPSLSSETLGGRRRNHAVSAHDSSCGKLQNSM